VRGYEKKVKIVLAEDDVEVLITALEELLVESEEPAKIRVLASIIEDIEDYSEIEEGSKLETPDGTSPMVEGAGK